MSDEVKPASTAYDELCRELRETDSFSSIGSVLAWDQETMMPASGTSLRAEQMAALSQLVHQRVTSSRFGDLLTRAEEECAGSPDPDAQANLREIRHDYDRAVRLPTALVREFAEVTTHAQMVWRKAREDSDFPAFAPWLERLVGLNRAKAECLMMGDITDPYDALLDGFEPGARAADVATAFAALRGRLTPLIREIAAGRSPDESVRRIGIPIERQAAFGRKVIERIGFDLEAGRLDISTHPFCQAVGPGDTRLTTRYRVDDWFDALSSTLHEAGHGLYEQNLPKTERRGLPLSEPASHGIHESQSRLWENIIGRSRAFWEWAMPEARKEFGDILAGYDVDDAYPAVNIVRPSLIRVDSDEVTYNLHIMLRFDIERALLAGDLEIHELPRVWNERIESDLGLEVPNDREGCLQDVHWSIGAIGYFPTYTLGNLYAGQFWATARERLPGIEGQISLGEFGPLLDWLKREIHQHGRRYSAPELCERVTGSSLSADPLIKYFEAKMKPLYRV